MMMVMAVGYGCCHDDIVVPMMPAAVIVECDLAMVAVMQALAVLIDDHIGAMMMVMSVDDDGVLRRSHSRRGQAQRQSAQDHDFHFEFSKKLRCPSPDKHRPNAFVPV
ncbi:hypothetical protein [Mesorhizobium sp. B2-4-12]|uniref:hypothetical protein n=1 Tax=Mesorhizobium sp. B2-4-12 TaxID=2589937 RepID=UPI0015E2A499